MNVCLNNNVKNDHQELNSSSLLAARYSNTPTGLNLEANTVKHTLLNSRSFLTPKGTKANHTTTDFQDLCIAATTVARDTHAYSNILGDTCHEI